MLSGSDRLSDRAKVFQLPVDIDEVKRRREGGAVELRRQKRHEQATKRRKVQTQEFVDYVEDVEKVTFPIEIVPDSLIKLEPRFSTVESDDSRLDILLQLILSNNDIATIQESVKMLRTLISKEGSAPLERVAASGIIPRLSSFLDCAYMELQTDCLWCLSNLASGSKHIVSKLFQANTVERCIVFLSSADPAIIDLAIWALANIGGEDPEYRDRVIELGAGDKVIEFLKSANNIEEGYLKNFCWFLSNLCKGNPAPKISFISQVLRILPQLITLESEEVLIEVGWIVCYISEGDSDRIQQVLNAHVAARVVDLIQHPNVSLVVPYLRTVGNILTGDDVQTQTLLNYNLIDKLAPLVTSKRRAIRKEAIWSFSNILAGNTQQVLRVLQHPCFKFILLACKDPDINIKRDAVYCISNACSCKDFEVISILMNADVLEVLVDVLNEQDANLLLLTLEGISLILGHIKDDFSNKFDYNQILLTLDEKGGISKIESLQNHPNSKVYDKVLSMLETLFNAEEVHNENMYGNFTVPSGGFMFS